MQECYQKGEIWILCEGICHDVARCPSKSWSSCMKKVVGRSHTQRISMSKSTMDGDVVDKAIGWGIFSKLWCLWSQCTRTTNRDSKGQLSICTVDEQLTLGLLKRLETHKATRMNGISSRLLKLTAPGIAGRLTHLFNCSLKTGEIPSEWKSANITPVFKKGKKADVNNYRPLSVLPIIAKVF